MQWPPCRRARSATCAVSWSADGIHYSTAVRSAVQCHPNTRARGGCTMAKRRAHGEGSIVQLADGTWRAAVPLADGKRKWIRGRTQTEVVRKVTEIRSRRDQGLPVASG